MSKATATMRFTADPPGNPASIPAGGAQRREVAGEGDKAAGGGCGAVRGLQGCNICDGCWRVGSTDEMHVLAEVGPCGTDACRGGNSDSFSCSSWSPGRSST